MRSLLARRFLVVVVVECSVTLYRLGIAHRQLGGA